MNNTLIWNDESTRGQLQVDAQYGAYQTPIFEKPFLEYSFTDLSYVEVVNEYTVDGVPMTDEQKAEVSSYLSGIEVPLAWYKQVKDLEARGVHDQAVYELVGKILPAELASWAKQESEARAWVADNNAVTPMIDNLLIGRNMGESKADIVAKIITKADGYAVAYAQVLGMYHAKQKALEACATVQEVVAF